MSKFKTPKSSHSESRLRRWIAEKIKFSSLASCHNGIVDSRRAGSAFTIIRSQCLVSRDSRLQRLTRYMNSFFDPASSASQQLAPTAVAARTNWGISGVVITFTGTVLAKAIIDSPNFAVRSSRSYFRALLVTEVAIESLQHLFFVLCISFDI